MQPPLPLPPSPLPPSLLSHQSVRAEGWEYVVDHCPDASYILKPPAIIYIMSLLPLLAALLRPSIPTTPPYIHARACPRRHTHPRRCIDRQLLTQTMAHNDTKTDSLVTYTEKHRGAPCACIHAHTQIWAISVSPHVSLAPHPIPVLMSEPDSSSQSLRLFLIFSFLSDLFFNPPPLSVMEWYYSDRS